MPHLTPPASPPHPHPPVKGSPPRWNQLQLLRLWRRNERLTIRSQHAHQMSTSHSICPGRGAPSPPPPDQNIQRNTPPRRVPACTAAERIKICVSNIFYLHLEKHVCSQTGFIHFSHTAAPPPLPPDGGFILLITRTRPEPLRARFPGTAWTSAFIVELNIKTGS